MMEARVDRFRPIDVASADLFREVGVLITNQDQLMKSLILAQNERWRRGLGMQVERESLRVSKAA
jgi:hypothetical protein